MFAPLSEIELHYEVSLCILEGRPKAEEPPNPADSYDYCVQGFIMVVIRPPPPHPSFPFLLG